MSRDTGPTNPSEALLVALDADMATLARQRRDDPVGYARGAIERLNARRSGRPRDDAYLDYAVNSWRAFLREAGATP